MHLTLQHKLAPKRFQLLNHPFTTFLQQMFAEQVLFTRPTATAGTGGKTNRSRANPPGLTPALLSGCPSLRVCAGSCWPQQELARKGTGFLREGADKDELFLHILQLLLLTRWAQAPPCKTRPTKWEGRMTGTIRRAGDKGDQIKIPILPTLRLMVFVVDQLTLSTKSEINN